MERDANCPHQALRGRVEVVATGTLALSTGPVFNPSGTRIGTFIWTWRREYDGRWRVVLDSGCPSCP